MTKKFTAGWAALIAILLVVLATPLPAQATTAYTARAEAKFITAKDQALGAVLNTVSAQFEGVEITCTPDSSAQDCTKSQSQDQLAAIPIKDVAGLELGAANNFASGNSKKGTSKAASGGVSDNGAISTGGQGQYPASLKLDLKDSALGPLTGIVDPELELGALSGVASLGSPTAKPRRDYNIAGGTLSLTVPALADFNEQVRGATSDSIDEIDSLGLSDFCDALPEGQQKADCQQQTEDALELRFPSANRVFEEIESGSGGVKIDLASGRIIIDLDAILEAAGLDINDLPPNTDLVPYIIKALDDAFAKVIKSVSQLPAFILDDSGLTIGDLDLPGSLLGDVVGPITETLGDSIADAVADLADNMPDLAGKEGLGQVLQLIVNVPDELDTSLVGGASSPGDSGTGAGTPELASATKAAAGGSDVYSQTALRVKLLQGQGADLFLGNAVVGPNQPITDKPGAPGNDKNAAPPADDLPNTGAPEIQSLLLLGVVSLVGGMVLLLAGGAFMPAVLGIRNGATAARYDGMNRLDDLWTRYVMGAVDWFRYMVLRR